MRAVSGWPAAYFVTTVTKDRRRLFDDIGLAKRLATMIRMACRTKGYHLLIHGILPDHLHLLVLPKITSSILEIMPSGSNNTKGTLSRVPVAVGNLVRSIKGTFSRSMMQGHVWQRRYNLRHIMTPEDLVRTVEYIQHNYQKHHLPERFGREPYVWLDQSIFTRAF